MVDLLDAVLIAAIVVMFVFLGAHLTGLDAARAPSEYTGYVVDIEDDKGWVFRTTQLKMKTHPRSSAVETFCVLESDKDELLAKARSALHDGTRLTVVYSRPHYVPIWKCQNGVSIARELHRSNETE